MWRVVGSREIGSLDRVGNVAEIDLKSIEKLVQPFRRQLRARPGLERKLKRPACRFDIAVPAAPVTLFDILQPLGQPLNAECDGAGEFGVVEKEGGDIVGPDKPGWRLR